MRSASFAFLLAWLLSGNLFLSTGKPYFHGTEPYVPRVRPSCSLFPRARVSLSFSLSGWNLPSRTSLCAAIRASQGFLRCSLL
jgi:hypothetical protein